MSLIYSLFIGGENRLKNNNKIFTYLPFHLMTLHSDLLPNPWDRDEDSIADLMEKVEYSSVKTSD